MKTELLSVYGARTSKSGKYLNLSLVKGEGDEKTFYNACVKMENVKLNDKDGYAVIKVKLLKESKHIEELEEVF